MKQRKYTSTDGKTAVISEHPNGVCVEVERRMRVCPDVNAAVEWLATEYSMAWLRSRYV